MSFLKEYVETTLDIIPIAVFVSACYGIVGVFSAGNPSEWFISSLVGIVSISPMLTILLRTVFGIGKK